MRHLLLAISVLVLSATSGCAIIQRGCEVAHGGRAHFGRTGAVVSDVCRAFDGSARTASAAPQNEPVATEPSEKPKARERSRLRVAR